MKQINTFFIIGTLGMLFSSMLHIILATYTSEEVAASALWVLYPIFAGFLIAGTVVMMKRKNSFPN
jgi:hypothetical protein